jgi:hypothetical protein
MNAALPAPAGASDPKLGAAAERALAQLRDGLADKLEWLLDAVDCPPGRTRQSGRGSLLSGRKILHRRWLRTRSRRRSAR